MTWTLLLLFCVSATDCRVAPDPNPPIDGYQSQIECLMRGSQIARQRGATTFRCRSSAREQEA